MTSLPIATILTLTCNNLRAECKKANLDTTGLKADLQQRLIHHHLPVGNDNDNDNDNDKMDNNNKENHSPAPVLAPKNSPALKTKFEPSDLVCPITLELPWDPVTAEDGRVYERDAILKHIATQKNGGALKSPMTNAPMGDRLLPALQHKNLTEALIQSGVLKGELVSKWNEKVKEKKAMEDLIKLADNSNSGAMLQVGNSYLIGEKGFKKDKKLAYTYYLKGHDAGNATATAMLGQCLWYGDGVEKCGKRGWFFMTMAAGQGSRYAMWQVGENLAKGKYGMEVDKKEAIRCLRVALKGDCALDDTKPEQMKKAQDLLDELTAVAN